MSPERLQQLYERDFEFRKLLARRADVDVATAALELARDAEPGLEFGPTHRWIADRAQELTGPVASAGNTLDALRALSACLAGRHELQGEPAAFSTPDGSFLHCVIETRRGLPIALSILYAAVGRRLGLDVYGVSSPAHFLVGCQTEEGDAFVDPFYAGRILTRDEAVGWLQELTGWEAADVAATLRPAEPREIVLRMLYNLKRIYNHLENWPAAWLVQQRLAALQPGVFGAKRDLGRLALRTQRPAQAHDLLRDCLKSCPPEERGALESLLSEARCQIAASN